MQSSMSMDAWRSDPISPLFDATTLGSALLGNHLPAAAELQLRLAGFAYQDDAEAEQHLYRAKVLAPDHPAFHTPNAITAADFDGWVQERGLDFPSEWDSQHLTALLACSDRGEAPLKSGLLVGKYGNGYFVYTGLSFFRQLPAGVPGAYRLFANLVSLGK